MALPVTVPRLGPPGGKAFVAEWYLSDGAAVTRGDLVLRIENDFAAIEVEAEEAGLIRHAAGAGSLAAPGEVIAYLLEPGETLPGDKAPAPRSAARKPATSTGKKAAASPRPAATRAARPATPPREPPPAPRPADLVPAPPKRAAPPVASDPLPGVPWEPFPSDEAAVSSGTSEPRGPLLLFPRIINELKEEAALVEEEPAQDEAPMQPPEPLPAAPAGAWELVPGESDFNPEWLLEPGEREPNKPAPGHADRFQASNIRSLAFGRGRSAEPPVSPALAPAGPAAPDPPEPQRSLTPEIQPGVVAPDRGLDVDIQERRGDHAPGPPLVMRVSIDVGEAGRMCDQLTREWWGSNVRPNDQDVILRAIARALHESAAFRRRTDVVGIRPLSGSSRTVHLLADAATRPFRDAVASLAALRDTPGAEIPCLCTLTDFGALGLDDAVAALPGGQPLAFAMGAVRDTPRFQGDKPRRASELSLTLSYDSDAMPEGAAARLLGRVRELVEAPYALLAD